MPALCHEPKTITVTIERINGDGHMKELCKLIVLQCGNFIRSQSGRLNYGVNIDS